MLEDEKDLVTDTVDREGFDYTFRCYSHFKIVSDKKFHKLRRKYIDAANELAEYLGLCTEDVE